MTGPTVDLEKLRGIVEDPKKASALPPTLLAKIHLDLAAKDATAVEPSSGILMQQTGITPERAGAYQGNISESAYNNISPTNYDGWFQKTGHGLKIIRDLIVPTMDNPEDKRWKGSHAQEDSWRLYLGKPQEYGTFGESAFKPSNATQDTKYYKINGMLESWLASKAADNVPFPGDWAPAMRNEFKSLVEQIKNTKGQKIAMNDDYRDTPKSGIMRNFQMSHGHDEVGPYLAYYDIWDLHTPLAKVVGKPYEIYDRIYYDPKTYDPIPESEVLAKKAKLDLTHPDNKKLLSEWASKFLAK